MKTNSKQAKFFCESCGSEVNANAKFCGSCGKFFASVRCPNCGKTGTTKEFENGCPDCGYAVGSHKNYSGELKNNKNISIFNKILTKNSKKQSNSDSLPFWVYLISIMALIGILICVYSCL